jgi:hypothetical protein
MVDSVHSGYKHAATTVTFTTNLFDAMAVDEWTAASDEIDNSSLLYLFMDIHVTLGSAAFTGASLPIYLIPSIDDTLFGDWRAAGATTDEEVNESYFIGSVTTSTDTAAQELTLRNVACPPGKFKLGIRNKTAVILGATNVMKFRRWGYKSA